MTFPHLRFDDAANKIIGLKLIKTVKDQIQMQKQQQQAMVIQQQQPPSVIQAMPMTTNAAGQIYSGQQVAHPNNNTNNLTIQVVPSGMVPLLTPPERGGGAMLASPCGAQMMMPQPIAMASISPAVAEDEEMIEVRRGGGDDD